jgi:ABC-type multidrug transport system fused ATPase/permease subunit
MFRKRQSRVVASAPVAAPVAGPVPPPAPVDGIETPHVLRFAAAWSWRLLIVVAAIWVFLQVFALLSVVLVPVIIGLLLAAVASPVADRLTGWGLPRGLATLVTIVLGMSLVVGLVTLVAQQFTSGFGELRDQFDQSLGKLERYLADLGLSRDQLQDFFDRVRDGVGSGGATSAAPSCAPRPRPDTCSQVSSSSSSRPSSSPTTAATSGAGSCASSPTGRGPGSRAAECVRGPS